MKSSELKYNSWAGKKQRILAAFFPRLENLDGGRRKPIIFGIGELQLTANPYLAVWNVVSVEIPDYIITFLVKDMIGRKLLLVSLQV